MDDRQLAYGMALGRMGFGLAFMLAPERAGRGWVGRDSRRTATRVAFRALGVRDFALGLRLLLALRAGAPVRRWLAMGAVADAVDFAATFPEGDLPLGARLFTGAMASTGTAAGLDLARRLD